MYLHCRSRYLLKYVVSESPVWDQQKSYTRDMCLWFWSVNIICMYNFDLLCNIHVSFRYVNVAYMCTTFICEYHMYESFDLWMLYHLCVLYSIHVCLLGNKNLFIVIANVIVIAIVLLSAFRETHTSHHLDFRYFPADSICLPLGPCKTLWRSKCKEIVYKLQACATCGYWLNLLSSIETTEVNAFH